MVNMYFSVFFVFQCCLLYWWSGRGEKIEIYISTVCIISLWRLVYLFSCNRYIHTFVFSPWESRRAYRVSPSFISFLLMIHITTFQSTQYIWSIVIIISTSSKEAAVLKVCIQIHRLGENCELLLRIVSYFGLYTYTPLRCAGWWITFTRLMVLFFIL